MKKLLYTLFAVSNIFSAFKKEDKEPTNSGNNNIGIIEAPQSTHMCLMVILK